MRIYSDESRANDEHALSNVEVFYADDDTISTWNDESSNEWDALDYTAGWYYWACFPGCMPDSDPIGPFDTEQDAINDAQENA